MFSEKMNLENSDKEFIFQKLKSTKLRNIPFAFNYGSTLEGGIYAGQVLPNNTKIADEEGMKIFLCEEYMFLLAENLPIYVMDKEIFEEDFLTKLYQIHRNSEKYHIFYQVGVAGHEFGHILWKFLDTETALNTTGNFKNVEEWKATVGGLLAYFYFGDKKDFEDIFVKHIYDWCRRISRRYDKATKPYYLEDLIHLDLLKKVGLISFDFGHIFVNFEENSFEKVKEIYTKYYEKLVEIYLKREDATIFLEEFFEDVNGEYLPKDLILRNFVEIYYNLQKEIGTETF